MKRFITNIFFITAMSLLMGFPALVLAQGTVSGNISDSSGPLEGATVLASNTTTGAFSDGEGNYSLSLAAGTYTIEARYIGYASKTIQVTITDGGTATANFVLESDFGLDEIIVTGTRASNRTNTDAPVPVDVIDVERTLLSLPQTTINSIMHYAAPSFSSNTQTISDGTDHIDPASLRGLGPDQVLVLINGKRRHTTSLVNVNGTFGRGSVGTDMNSIPAAAIKKIEVLRDGAAAQYGSDAIAGVINLQLKDAVNVLRFTVNAGANFTKNSSPEKDVDGGVTEISANYGIPMGENGGFLNLTGNFDYRDWTSRMQTFTGDIFNAYNSVEWVADQAGADLSNLSMNDIQNYSQGVGHFSPELKGLIAGAPDMDSLQNLLGGDVTDAELAARGQVRSDYNMRVGQSALRGGKFFANLSLPMGDNAEFYSFGGMGYRRGNSGCFYRLPSQSRAYTPTYINGFRPEINSNIVDKSVAAGIRGKVGSWDVDLSNTYGQNQFLFEMTNTHNATMQNASPLTFQAGGHSFTQNTANLDISQYFDQTAIEGINVAFGAEYRYENFRVIPGSEFSYGNYDVDLNLVNSVTPSEQLVTDFHGRNRPSGSQCFAGFLPSNDVDANRSSAAGYVDAEFDISKAFFVEGAVRFENYSDFGSTFNYKIASRYKFTDNIALRAAHSTGFRAPSLHQIHFSRTSTIFVTENGATTAKEVGVFTNTSRAAQLLGIPQLQEETSQNFSAGITLKVPGSGLKITIDGYMVNIDNRIVLTGQFAPGNDPDLIQIFSQAQANAAAFFANAIDTKSQGVDIVIAHKTVLGTKGILTNNLAATLSQTRQDGEINSSALLKEKGLEGTYFDETSRIYLEEAVPRTKITLSNSLNMGKLTVYLRNTYFGETTEATNIDPTSDIDYYYSGKVITDLSVGIQFTDDWSFTIGSNNLLDVYPDLADEAFQSSGRFLYSRRSPQFSMNGRHAFARLTFGLK